MTGDYVLSSPFVSSACEKDAKILQFIKEITKIVDVIRQNVSNEILTQNSQIEYLIDRLIFKSNIRIITHEDIQRKIQHTKDDPHPFLNNFFNSHFHFQTN
ncbi:hypothetical protein R3W88_032237 [Solanum pinnatisectum]|uniref:Uncharacterized protein n=1 Tax=Solanum pinnatisectum TaxID=50273 RepID=A0AAV9LR83_9SOLN|nr:hypothetical protein R3W88_032237 [Solanum pinnatisectum]